VLHQGVPLSFKQSFNLAHRAKVVAANVENGLLTVRVLKVKKTPFNVT
jgi:HSP20 family molecular chaperone IbpA